jgi:hypothetical protein
LEGSNRERQSKQPHGSAPDWHVQYRKNEAEQIGWFATPEEAIETACGLIDEGCDVYGIGAGSLDDTIARDQILRIYDLWAKVKPLRNISVSTLKTSRF